MKSATLHLRAWQSPAEPRTSHFHGLLTVAVGTAAGTLAALLLIGSPVVGAFICMGSAVASITLAMSLPIQGWGAR